MIILEHVMGLFEEHLNNIKNGNKTIEVRLNDEKRKKIKTGDIIQFIKVPRDGKFIKVKVLDTTIFPTFKEMYENISAKEMGSCEESIEKMIEDTYEIYTPEQEKTYGTVAIKIKYLS